VWDKHLKHILTREEEGERERKGEGEIVIRVSMLEKEIVFLFTTKTDLEGHNIVADSWGGGFECFMLNLCQLSVQPFYV